MEKYIYNEQNGLWYELQGDYYIPCLVLPIVKKNDISAYGDIDIYGGDLSMRKRKYYLYLTAEERRYIFNALLSYRNKRIAQGRYTDAVDEVMIKLQK